MKKWAILSVVVPVVAIIWYWFIGPSFYIAIALAAAGFGFAQKGEMANKKLAVVGKVLNGILAGMAVVMFILQLITAFNSQSGKKRMKKKVFGIICAIFMIGALTGCGANGDSSTNTNGSGGTAKIKGNCHAVECIKQITVGSTVSDINKIMGFDGELTDEKYNIYYWGISEDEGIKVAYYSGSKGTITADINRDTLANSKVDFSRYSELQPKIKEGITYNEFKSYIGNVDGTITEKAAYLLNILGYQAMEVI